MKTLIFLSLFFTLAHAAELRCHGTFNGQRVAVKATGDMGLTGVSNPKGGILIDGRPVADFEGRNVKINFFRMQFTAKNDRGDAVAAKVTSLSNGTGVLSYVVVPSHGVNWRNVPVTCNL